jgi:flavin prenyltransferase
MPVKMKKKKIVIAVTAASGSLYANLLINKLNSPEIIQQIDTISLVFSKHAHQVWEQELGHFDPSSFPFKIYEFSDFYAPFASGSANYGSMIICPCSMGTMGRIANGISDDLITRAADVMLKEQRQLILVPRETPLNLIHVKNMKSLIESGAVICPASPSFYSRPGTIDELAMTVVNRILHLLDIETETYRWPGNK